MDDMTMAVLAQAVGEGGSGNARTVHTLEERFAQLWQATFALCVHSGTSALIAALWACGVRPGDAVAVSSLGPAMTGLAIAAVGARPVFLDCASPRSFGIGVEAARSSLGQAPKAVVLVPMWGYWDEDPEALDVFRSHGIPLIIDAAQAPLLRLRDGLCEVGDVVCLSLHGRKPIKAGEGGVCLTNHRHLADRIVALRNFGQDAAVINGHLVPAGPFATRFGTNMKINALGAAWCLAQMTDLASLRARLQRLRRFAVTTLDATLVTWTEATTSSAVVQHGGYGIVATCSSPADAIRMTSILNERGLEVDTSRYHYQPMYASAYFAPHARCCPMAEELTATAVACRLEAFLPLDSPGVEPR